MGALLPTVIVVLGVIALVSFLAQRGAIPAPVVLAVAGIVWSLIPSLPTLEIAPRVILSVFLPPLLYADAWQASWVDFRRWLRPILQLAVGLVAFTIAVVGVVAHQLIPGLSWGASFLLGAIVSPTDTVAVQAVLERLRVQRRATAILGGEALVNDATGLLGVGLATVVVTTGVFEAGAIGLAFARIVGLGVAIGVAVGWTASALNRVVRGTQVLFVLSLVAPYAAYFLAEDAGASGVIAVVIAGFVASVRLHYIAPESRVDLYASWNQLSFLLNGVMFLFVGLAAPHRLEQAVEAAPGILWSALGISAAVIAARFAWMFPGAYLPPSLLPGLREFEGGYPEPRAVVLAAWCGVRGAVSLAAALSVPFLLPDGTPFPGRAEIVTSTLVVILVTLLGQVLTMLPLVRYLGLSDADPSDVEMLRARERMLAAGIARLDAFCTQESCPISVYRLREAMSDQLASLQAQDELARSEALHRLEVASEVRRAVYQAETEALLSLRDRGELNDRVHQELQRDLDRENSDARAA